MLRHYGVEPWVVLDGRRTPMKVLIRLLAEKILTAIQEYAYQRRMGFSPSMNTSTREEYCNELLRLMRALALAELGLQSTAPVIFEQPAVLNASRSAMICLGIPSRRPHVYPLGLLVRTAGGCCCGSVAMALASPSETLGAQLLSNTCMVRNLVENPTVRRR